MMIDPVKKIVGMKRAYERQRGTRPSTGMRNRSTGKLLLLFGQSVPLITWEDALFASHNILANLSTGTFTQSLRYRQARKDFLSAIPSALDLMRRMGKKELYPRAEEFWGYAVAFALERSSLTALPSWLDMTVESIWEATKELPDTLKILVPDVNDLVPDVSSWADLVKWVTIGSGVAFLAYLYTKRSEK